jgi:uncharacterized SAM-binding protein YcdF (DUF218 family)
MARKKRKLLLIFFSLLLVAGAVLVFFRDPVLAGIANFLIVDDRVEKADIIEVLAGSSAMRSRKAAELFFQGLAPKIVLTKMQPVHNDLELRKYGIRLLENHEETMAVLKVLKVPDAGVEIVDGYNGSTVDEARRIKDYALQRGVKRVIVVTSSYHSRRSRMIFRRVFKGTGIQISLRPAPEHSHFDSRQWWKSREEAKAVFLEYQKLVYYALRYW